VDVKDRQKMIEKKRSEKEKETNIFFIHTDHSLKVKCHEEYTKHTATTRKTSHNKKKR
jgi:hypothetical protein